MQQYLGEIREKIMRVSTNEPNSKDKTDCRRTKQHVEKGPMKKNEKISEKEIC